MGDAIVNLVRGHLAQGVSVAAGVAFFPFYAPVAVGTILGIIAGAKIVDSAGKINRDMVLFELIFNLLFMTPFVLFGLGFGLATGIILELMFGLLTIPLGVVAGVAWCVFSPFSRAIRNLANTETTSDN